MRAVTAISEMLTAEDGEAISAAFGVPVINMFVSTEGLAGHSEPGGGVCTFASDTCIAECVDDAGRPVPDGTASARVGLPVRKEPPAATWIGEFRIGERQRHFGCFG